MIDPRARDPWMKAALRLVPKKWHKFIIPQFHVLMDQIDKPHEQLKGVNEAGYIVPPYTHIDTMQGQPFKALMPDSQQTSEELQQRIELLDMIHRLNRQLKLDELRHFEATRYVQPGEAKMTIHAADSHPLPCWKCGTTDQELLAGGDYCINCIRRERQP